VKRVFDFPLPDTRVSFFARTSIHDAKLFSKD